MIEKRFKLKRKYIVMVQFIIEGYEGMATVTTIEPQTAIIKISIIPDFLADMSDLINYLKNKYEMEEISISAIKQ
ncbi:MAG: DUF4911 domain-containing protein [Deltaproteobacteria bacterium]|nr:DUF4911 domain-containing protein [Deltaproteobacteria bacterium]